MIDVLSKDGMDFLFFIKSTVIILAVSGLMNILCKEGRNKVSWLLVLTPFIIIGYIGSRV